MRITFTKEMDGTLLVVFQNGDTFEVSRGANSNNIHITPDESNEIQKISSAMEREILTQWTNSNCRYR